MGSCSANSTVMAAPATCTSTLTKSLARVRGSRHTTVKSPTSEMGKAHDQSAIERSASAPRKARESSRGASSRCQWKEADAPGCSTASVASVSCCLHAMGEVSVFTSSTRWCTVSSLERPKAPGHHPTLTPSWKPRGRTPPCARAAGGSSSSPCVPTASSGTGADHVAPGATSSSLRPVCTGGMSAAFASSTSPAAPPCSRATVRASQARACSAPTSAHCWWDRPTEATRWRSSSAVSLPTIER